MLINKKTEMQGVHYSRYIASWRNAGGIYFGEQFATWLRANGCTEQEISDIREMANNGKVELEVNATGYVDTMKRMIEMIDNGIEPTMEP